MTTGNTTLLGLALPVEGELDGTWGDIVNDSITSLVDAAVAGTTTLSTDADVTLTDTVLAANQARQAILLWTASNGATTRNITAPARSKAYIVINAGTGSVVLRGAGPTTGVTIVSGEKCLAGWNGSDFVKIASSVVDGVSTFSGGTTGLTPSTATSGAVTLAGTLAVANGGTGTATPALVQGTGVTITGSWPNQTINATGSGGTVTAVSVATANGFAGTSSGGTTPALTLSTSVTGVLKGNGTAISAATAGTDYVAPGGALGTPSSGTLSDCTVDGTTSVGFRSIPQNSQSAAYELVLADSGKHILHPSADTTARTFTIPANSSVAYPIGTAITFINQNGAGVVTIAITSDTMRLSPTGETGSRTLAANGSATCIKLTATEWLISGSGLT